VLGVAVAEVVLDQPEVMALVGQVVAAGVAQRVGMDTCVALQLTVRLTRLVPVAALNYETPKRSSIGFAAILISSWGSVSLPRARRRSQYDAVNARFQVGLLGCVPPQLVYQTASEIRTSVPSVVEVASQVRRNVLG